MSTHTDSASGEPQANPRKTLLGNRLDEIRGRIKASGEPLLSWDEIEAELDRADSTQPEPQPDPVRASVRRRIEAWEYGSRGCV